MGDEKDSAYGPAVEVVMQNEEIGSAVFEDGALHFGVGGVDNSAAKRLRLAFQLKWRLAKGAKVINRDGVARRDSKPWRFASGAEEISGAPRFSAYASTLRGAFVMVEASGGKVQVHAEIRSQSLVNPESAIMRL